MEESEQDSFIDDDGTGKYYDPLDYGSSEERQYRKRDKKRQRKAETGFRGKQYVYYDDRSE